MGSWEDPWGKGSGALQPKAPSLMLDSPGGGPPNLILPPPPVASMDHSGKGKGKSGGWGGGKDWGKDWGKKGSWGGGKGKGGYWGKDGGKHYGGKDSYGKGKDGGPQTILPPGGCKGNAAFYPPPPGPPGKGGFPGAGPGGISLPPPPAGGFPVMPPPGMSGPGTSAPSSGFLGTPGPMSMPGLGTLPPLGGLPPMPPGMGMAGGCSALALPGGPTSIIPPAPANLASELAALVSAAAEDEGPSEGKVKFPPPEPRPRLVLLICKLPPGVEDSQLQVLLEQCGEVQGVRRARSEDQKPLSFAFAQFEDAEAAWKASVCLAGLKLQGQALKVFLEEAAEARIDKWRAAQKSILKVQSDEELAWELERKSVSCRSQIDAKVAEMFGGADESGGAYVAEKTQELRERERARVERVRKRKAWVESEFAKELGLVESVEKRLRREEAERDQADRDKEDADTKKEDPDSKLKNEDKMNAHAMVSKLADDQQLWKMVDRVQSEPREDLFKLSLDVSFLRNERIFEGKLRPWLERKIELYMGGQQSDLVEYIIRRINSASHPEALISDLMRFLDDHAEPIVERMWRMLAWELHRAGLALQEPLQWEDA
mmetsp:Transcript_66587/g.144604  ORF Transcript_66587/g.144604 Transcript_66587/m.144604 type:complete len:600 (-) Transcript_66587:90-1889(-)|eukprot:CAMPEP_0206434802 /NCGR_PEP_ID=MMETSP0324_2-20121206/9420_1 /ASSEMBLY_ACC=CAM_ASM_000836 /TAXON_ID=2866 /ORGANISM="Crypthecodinium cohnii, Strain Seligo" /LENGTH=599 /DNA_ID=CAMNT_0053901477 /DNA_START=218 /DNA_END=2020 /DNA_ORIENTATION=+